MKKDEMLRNAVSNYSQTVLKLAYSYVHNSSDAEDIAQDVFLHS